MWGGEDVTLACTIMLSEGGLGGADVYITGSHWRKEELVRWTPDGRRLSCMSIGGLISRRGYLELLTVHGLLHLLNIIVHIVSTG